MRTINDLLREADEANASDIHVTGGRAPFLRIDGILKPVIEEKLSAQEVEAMIADLLGKDSRLTDELEQRKQVDFSYSIETGARFRINVFEQISGRSAAMRRVPAEIKTVEELNLPPHILQLSEKKQGFVLVTGPAGHGKSTTLAAMIEHINIYRHEHIITIEDPIEYIFSDQKSIIDQREIGRDALSFAEAIRATLRQDPNVILVGEMRDPETMQAALTLAETGHLVFASLHTNDAAQTVERIIDTFQPAQQSQIRSQLAGMLTGIISQRLLPAAAGGRVPAVEILMATTAIRNAIREDKNHQIPGMIQTGSDKGMQTLEDSIKSLVNFGLVDKEMAAPYLLMQSAAPPGDKKK